MTKAIIGKKIGMTQIFDEAGKVVPVTVIEAGPCVVVQKKTTENDGYEAVQLGFGDVTSKHLNKPMSITGGKISRSVSGEKKLSMSDGSPESGENSQPQPESVLVKSTRKFL